MKKRIFFSVLIFMFTWVAVGAWDCGCVFASTEEMLVHKSAVTSEGMDCHSSEEAQSKKAKDLCCSGCQLESKASVPLSVQISGTTQSRFSDFNLRVSPSSVLGLISLVTSPPKYLRFQIQHARAVSFYDTPIYLAVQSFLI